MSTRRNFIRKTAIIGAGISLAPQFTFSTRLNDAEQNLNVGLIGVRLRGINHLNNVLPRDDVNVVAICDIDERRIAIAQEILEKYDHPLWKKFEKHAKGVGHGGMDFFVINAFVESAKQNITPPLDAYDAAAWSAITPLSEVSITNNVEPQNFPDFTLGDWVNRKPYNWMKDTY